MISLKEILVATDFGEASETALRYGRELARRFDARLHVLTVVDLLQARLSGAEAYVANLAEAQAEMEAQAKQDLEALLSDEDRTKLRAVAVVQTSTTPAAAIVDYAKEQNIDLILVGTHGRGAVAHLFLGSVAERVVRFGPCPVLTVREHERDFVVRDALQTATQTV